MSDEKYTREPWCRSGCETEVDVIYGYDGDAVASTYFDDVMFAVRDANARRIVACVNTCAGIPTATLEAGGAFMKVVKEAVTNALDEWFEDKHAPPLLDALETAVRWLRRLEKEYPGCLNDDAIDKHLMPILKKARGEK